ncbi:MAG: hypothetical protein BEN18_00330 [Epulopiscium sp. Nuni2H_MBin001]|nr:MAG: hypothetical protein BEN18_00330 [Epulopiscium sp. Nuni2H_MBin001]
MELKKCRDCRTLFQYTSGPVYCSRCKLNHESLIKDIKDYLYDYPHTDIKMLSEALNISPKLIEGFIRSGRIELTSDSPIKITCDVCGVRIQHGRVCDDCQKETADSFKEVSGGGAKKEAEEAPMKSEGIRMHNRR